MSNLQIIALPELTDNYTWLVHCRKSGKTAVIDPSGHKKVIQYCLDNNWHIDFILNTHHHYDHIGGNKGVAKYFNAKIVGHEQDKHRIPDMDIRLKEGDIFNFANYNVKIIDVSGHTIGHIAYFFVEEKILFCGDSLFSFGCGRMFEGNPEMFWQSLAKIKLLPDDTKIFCAHEYTYQNWLFASSLDKDNVNLAKQKNIINTKLQQNNITLPTTLSYEKQYNPFLQADNLEFQKKINMQHCDPATVFAYIRKLKDQF